MTTVEELDVMIEQAAARGDYALAGVLTIVAGARREGTENALIRVMMAYAEESVKRVGREISARMN